MLDYKLVILMVIVLKMSVSFGQINEHGKWIGSFSSENMELKLRPDGSFALKSHDQSNSFSIAGEVLRLNNDTAELCYYNYDSIIPMKLSSATNGLKVQLVLLQSLGCTTLDTLKNHLLNGLFKISLVPSQKKVSLSIGSNNVPTLNCKYHFEISLATSSVDTSTRRIFRTNDFEYNSDLGYEVKLFFILDLLYYRDLGRIQLVNNDNVVFILYEDESSKLLYRYIVKDR